MPTPSWPQLCGHWPGDRLKRELHSFQLELPSEITHAEAYNAGVHHIEQTLKLRQYFDYRWWASRPHPTMSGMSIFSYNYKA
jgi:hypothetical protein